MKEKIQKITRYFGFLTVLIEYLGVLLLVIIKRPDLTEPFSQYGYYSSTMLLFGVLFTAAALIYYLFSLNLNAYWKYTSKITLLAGLFFIITGWTPYTPQAGAYVLDLHNIAVMIAITLYSTPMLFIGYKTVHKNIARSSKALFYVTFVLVMLSLVSRILDIGVIHAQLASIIPFHIWLVTTNILLLQHHKQNDAKL